MNNEQCISKKYLNVLLMSLLLLGGCQSNNEAPAANNNEDANVDEQRELVEEAKLNISDITGKWTATIDNEPIFMEFTDNKD